MSDLAAGPRRLDAAAAGALHDLNNTLQTLSASLRRLEKRIAQRDEAAVAALIGSMQGHITIIAEMAARLAGRSPPAAPDRAALPIPLAAFLQAMVPQIETLLDGHIVLDSEIAADCGDVFCEPSQLESAVRNLVLNARDALHAGGTLVLAARRSGLGPGRGTVALGPILPPAFFAEIIITDTGCGMTPDILRTCFEPFVSSKPGSRDGRGDSQGLGLFQIRTFTEAAGGSVNLESREGYGTIATILLPCNPPCP